MRGAFSTHGRYVNAYIILVRIPEWKRPLIRPRRIEEDKIRMYLREVWREGMDWMHLAQDRDQ